MKKIAERSSTSEASREEPHANEEQREQELDEVVWRRELVNSLNEFELFLKVRGVLVKTNDEVLNNLQDQSKFLVTFELTSSLSSSSSLSIAASTTNELSNSSGQTSNLVKIVMIPLDWERFLKYYIYIIFLFIIFKTNKQFVFSYFLK